MWWFENNQNDSHPYDPTTSAVARPPTEALRDGTPKESSKPINRIISATWV